MFRFDRFELDTEKRALRCGSETRAIEPQVYALLKFLIENRTRLVTREEIFKHVWGGRIVSESVLDTRINAVRRAIDDDGTSQRLIKTFRRAGVRFVGTVIEQIPQLPVRNPLSQRATPLALMTNSVPSISISQFTFSGDQQRFRACAGPLWEELQFAFQKVDWLRVSLRVPQAASMGSNTARPDYDLGGSIRETQDSTVILARVQDSTTGVCLWSERYEFGSRIDQAEIAKLAQAVSQSAAHALFAVERLRARATPVGRRSLWQTLVVALSLINTRNKKRVAGAASMLREIIAAETQSSLPFSLLAFCEVLSVHFGWTSHLDGAQVVKRLLEEAFERDDQDCWAHLSFGYSRLQIDKRPDEAIDSFEQTLQLEPNLSMAYYLSALSYVHLGQAERALTHADRAEQLAPADLLARGNSGVFDNVRSSACFVANRFQEGIAFARKAIARSPLQVPAYRQMVLNGVFLEDVPLAERALRKVKTFAPDVQRWLVENEPMWARKEDYKRYLRAFSEASRRVQ